MEFLAIVVGLVIVAVIVTGGSFKRLAAIPIVSAWVLVLALAIQVALEYVPVDRARYDDLGIGLLMFSYALLLGFCLINLSVRGIGVIAIGFACNALVIGLNLGMPLKVYAGGRADATLKEQPAKDTDLLQFLGDVIVLPHPPLDGSISFGDLIVAVGLIDVAFWASRKRRTEVAAAAVDSATELAVAAVASAPEPARISPFTFVGQPPAVEPATAEPATAVVAPIPPRPEPDPAEPIGTPESDTWAPPSGTAVVLGPTDAATPEPEPEAPAPEPIVDAVPVDVPTRELPLPGPVEAVMVDDAAPARRPALDLPGPVEEKVKQPVWDPNRTAPVPTINAAPAQVPPPPPADASPDDGDDPGDPEAGVRTLWSAENGTDTPMAAVPPPTAPPSELEGRSRRPARRRRGTPPPAAEEQEHTQSIDLSAFEVRSDAGAARRAR